jgi:hypothetical protein
MSAALKKRSFRARTLPLRGLIHPVPAADANRRCRSVRKILAQRARLDDLQMKWHAALKMSGRADPEYNDFLGVRYASRTEEFVRNW